ncbi:MAG: Flp pilus assembly protein CpaB [Candidatus Eisenbacteria bacterium]|nr:Flp pilus assembly protein CpaB [Candidatus Eisenbacteria bacterium]
MVTANNGRAFMGLAVVLGLAAAAVGYLGLNSLASRAATSGSRNLRDVVVTATDLTFGVKLEKTMLRVVRYPKESVPMGAFSTVDSVAGQTTKVFLSAREPVTATKLSSRGGGLSMLVRPNMRAVSVEVNQVSGVSGFVLPGDRVDVLVTVNRVQDIEEAFTNTILQNTEVLAAGQKTAQQDNKPITVQAVTLLVSPRGAEQLAHAQLQGVLTLVLRNPEDQDTLRVASYTTHELMSSNRRPAPPSARVVVRQAPGPAPRHAAEPRNVRIIRSATVSEQPAPRDTISN